MKALLVLAAIFAINTAQAEVQELCGQQVDFNLMEPTKETTEFNNFIGVWLGTITSESAPCVAFVVESVNANGQAVVKQAWSGVGVDKNSGQLTWLGQITDNGRLVLISQYVNYVVYQSFGFWNKNTLDGYVVDPTGKYSVKLNRATR